MFESSTHGYDTVDHFAVDRRLGTEQDLTDLVEACHATGRPGAARRRLQPRRPRLPAVPARCSSRGRARAAASWFDIDASAPGPDGFGYRDFEGHSALVALDHGNPEVADHVAEVMTYWCDRGVDAWRLDAAYAVPPRFWREVLPRVRERHPDVWVVGEVLHGDYAGYVAESGIDSVTQYELWKAVWSSLNDRNLFELAHALRRHGGDGAVPSCRRRSSATTTSPGWPAGSTTRGTCRSRWPCCSPCPGVPTVYYGDEFGLRGVKEDREGGDDAVRPAAARERRPARPGTAAAIADLHRLLIGVRRRHPWLADAVVEEPDVLTNEVLAVRLTSGAHALAVVLNVGDALADVRLPMAEAAVVAGEAAVHDGAVQVPPHQFALVAAGG